MEDSSSCVSHFGLNSNAEVFQRTMEQLFSGYPCSIIVDDILVSGSTIQEHDENLQKVLKRCKEVNLKLNKQKCKVRVQEVSYVGHILTKNGVKPECFQDTGNNSHATS